MKDDKIGFSMMSLKNKDSLNAVKRGSLNFGFARANDFWVVSVLIVFTQSCVNEKLCEWY